MRSAGFDYEYEHEHDYEPEPPRFFQNLGRPQRAHPPEIAPPFQRSPISPARREAAEALRPPDGLANDPVQAAMEGVPELAQRAKERDGEGPGEGTAEEDAP